MAESKAFRPNDCTCFKEAVCIDAERIYDSCSDKDCLEDLQVFFSDKTQPIIDKAASIKCKKVKVINVCVDVESVPFNKGFYSVDMTFYFLVELSAYLSPGTPAVNCCGISYFSKKVILYGSEARGEAHSDSDIDLLILVNKEKLTLKEEQEITYPLYDIEIDTGVMINPIVISRKKWEDLKSRSLFYYNVMKDGVLL